MGTEQAFLLYVLSGVASAAVLLAFSVGAKLKLKQLSGKKKAYGKTLKGSFTMCV